MNLSDNKINYVFHHLKNHFTGESIDPANFIVVKETETIPSSVENKVIFKLSEKDKPNPVFVSYKETKLPVLFNLHGEGTELFRQDNKDNIIFCYDFLASVFYLLSGQQEIEKKESDQFGRFPYETSIQKELDSVHLPLVNYYFEMIGDGLQAYARMQGKELSRKRLFNNFGFALSHDVDRIAFFHPFLVLYRIKQLLGLAPMNYSKFATLKVFIKGLLFNLNPFRQPDPWWNFDWMINLEKSLGIRSTFFFLRKEDRFDNSLYKFKSRRVKNLISRLQNDGFEVGLHGTIRSTIDGNNLRHQKEELTRVTGKQPVGIRQHYLSFKHPETFRIQEGAGLIYDTTLAFAEHDGYRNGYCYPFHPYDFENDCMMQIWELPLVMMEVSVLNYRGVGFETTREAVMHYVAEAQKFGGLFSLLWHNCRLSNHEFDNITDFYESLLEQIMEKKPEALSGKDVIDKMA